MKPLKIILIVILLSNLSCIKMQPLRKQSIKLKLKDGTEFEEEYVITHNLYGDPSAEKLIKILKEIKKGNKKNINKSLNSYVPQTPLSVSIKKYKYDPKNAGESIQIEEERINEEASTKVTRYLLEQGADLNIKKIKVPNYFFKPKKSNWKYNLETKMYTKEPILMSCAPSMLERRKEKYKKSAPYTALFLSYGAKIKNQYYQSSSENVIGRWELGSHDVKKFLKEVCNYLLKEADISKLDPDFIDYIKDKVDETLLKKIKDKKKADEFRKK